MKNNTVLDTALTEKYKAIQNTFLNEWKPEQSRIVRIAIANHFSNREINTHHGKHPAKVRRYQELADIFGLAYTSSSNYAGLWVCNTEIYSNHYPGFKYIGFALTNDLTPYAVLWDKDENEILMPI